MTGRFTRGGQLIHRGVAPPKRPGLSCVSWGFPGGGECSSNVGDLLVLWDVDGTLLNAGGVGTDLYNVVFLQLFGRSLEAYAPMAGRTDRAIILETLELAGVPEARRYVDPFIAGLTAHAPKVREAVAIRGHALPGAAAALAALASAAPG